ncbi:MAG: right-handed parallel beta-helix repeat-containing protein [Candidatus Eisenbacteria sp.]|nr:right-handed parallel beta-helix repeat-containing protein [Candidatus Eisenbacteria bacterium]
MRYSILICALLPGLWILCPSPAIATDSFEPNNSMGEAHGLSSATPIESWISETGDQDWYTFQMLETGSVEITLWSLPLDYDMEFWRYDAAADSLVLIARSENPETQDEFFSGTVSDTGSFYVRIYADLGVYDPNDSYFLVATWPQAPTVTVNSPNGGECWTTGSSQTITYTATDPDIPDENLIISLAYSIDSGTHWIAIDSAEANTGSYAWTVPGVYTTRARVRVTADDGQLQTSDASNADFSIYGTTYVVRPDGSGDYAKIQLAIDAASGGDIIELTNGTFTGYQNRDLDYLGKAILIRSESATPSACVIDCGSAARGFHFHSGEGSVSVLQDITITNGYKDDGGGICFETSSSPLITGCIFSSNVAAFGNGGAIYCDRSSSPAFTNCTFSSNTASHGNGGAIYCHGTSSPTLTGCTLSGNAANWGGAIFGDSASCTITNCIFSANAADWSGGGIDCHTSSPTLTGCVFWNNTAGYNGAGAICWLSSSPTFTSCTFFGNDAGQYGGGVSCWHSSAPTFGNTIIAESADGEALHCDATSSATFSCCDLYNNEGGDWTGGIAGQLGTNGNISQNPLFCDAANGDFHLEEHSPCAPDSQPTCGLIGADSVGCTGTSGPNVLCIPDTLELTFVATSGDQVVTYTGGGSGSVHGYEIDVEWDHTVISAAFAKPDAGPFASALFFDTVTVGNGHVKVIASLAAGDPGAQGPDDLFKSTFSSAAANTDTSNVDLTLTAFRDSLNNTLTGFSEDDGLVIVDLGPVISDVAIENTSLTTNDYIKDGDGAEITATVQGNGALTIRADLTGLGGGASVAPDSYVGNVATWTLASVTTAPSNGTITVTISAEDAGGNVGDPASDEITADNTAPTILTGLAASPGHQQVSLTWNAASGNDVNYEGVTIRALAWGDYPTYATDPPGYPEDEVAGFLAYFGASTSTVHVFNPASDRDVYYYGGFVFDWARNYSISGSTARATNYWLGDVVPDGNWDGLVNTNDISLLGSQFYLNPLTNAQVDVAPTDDGSRTGIPEPDGAADFEDVMIFSMNFGIVSDPLPQFRVPDAASVALYLRTVEDPEPAEWTTSVILDDPAGAVQGVRFVLDYDPDCLHLLEVTEGTLLTGQAVFFIAIDGDVSITALGLGRTFGGSGELARLRLRSMTDGPIPLGLRDEIARNVLNQDLLPQPDAALASVEAPIPTRMELRQNEPNPVAATTTIAFSIARESEIRLLVYDVNGRLVRTLIDGTLPAGVHKHVWDCRDECSNPVSSGIYLYKLEAGDQSANRKMVVLR